MSMDEPQVTADMIGAKITFFIDNDFSTIPVWPRNLLYTPLSLCDLYDKYLFIHFFFWSYLAASSRDNLES